MNFYFVIQDAIEKANRTGQPVDFSFNDIPLRAYPNVQAEHYLKEIYNLRKGLLDIRSKLLRIENELKLMKEHS